MKKIFIMGMVIGLIGIKLSMNAQDDVGRYHAQRSRRSELHFLQRELTDLRDDPRAPAESVKELEEEIRNLSRSLQHLEP